MPDRPQVRGWGFWTRCLCGQCGPVNVAQQTMETQHLLRHWRRRSRVLGALAETLMGAGIPSDLPFEDLCLAAHDRQRETGNAQILVLFDQGMSLSVRHLFQQDRAGSTDSAEESGKTGDTGRGLVAGRARLTVKGIDPDAERQPLWGELLDGGEPVFATLVEVCSLGKLAHPGLLYAMATGCDQIWIQAAQSPADRRLQLQELAMVEALGGAGRFVLFSHVDELREAAVQPPTASLQILPGITQDSSRWEIVRNCAQVLLPVGTTRVRLPDWSPYGRVTLTRESCDCCQACHWICPTGAISFAANGRGFDFTESKCIQCGLCVSACPQRALRLSPCMTLKPRITQPQRRDIAADPVT